MLPFTLLLPASTASEITEGRELAECWAEHAVETGLNSWSRPAEDPSPRVQGLNSWSRPAEDPSPRVQGLNSWSRPAEDPSPRVQGLNSWSRPAGDPSPRVHSQCRLCCTFTGWNLLESLGFSVGEKKRLVLDTRFFS